MFSKKNKQQILRDNRENGARGETPEQRKLISKEVDTYLSAVRGFETDNIRLIRKNAQLAWRIAGVSCGVTVLVVIAMMLLTPLKTVVPYVIRVDNNTGYADVARPISDNKTTYGQEVDKYFLSRFVINRESYDWETIQSMHDAVKLLGNPNVFSQYDNIIKNKQISPIYLLKQEKKVMVRVVSVSFIGDIAQVRFIKYVQNADGSKAAEFAPASYIATIAYDYKKPIHLEKDRLVNPLGFEAISYRVDAENTETAK